MTPDTYVKELVPATPRRYAFRSTEVAEARRWQTEFRAELSRALGLRAMASRGAPALNAQLLAVDEQPDHIRQDWLLETEPGYVVPFYLLHPHGSSGKLPLVLTPHGHGKMGRRTQVGLPEGESRPYEDEDVALQAVREGYIVIAPDMRGFAGLRRSEQVEHDEDNSCRTMQLHALLFGRTLVGERVWDVQRLIDWAVTRREIDAEAIVVTGNSGGGTVTLFAAAIDERIRVCVPSGYYCTFEASIGSIHHCECNYVPGLLRLGEMWDVAGLVAPRPFLALSGEEDPIFPIDAARESFERLQEIYRVFGAESLCRHSVNPGGHRYYKRDVWPFVRRALAGEL